MSSLRSIRRLSLVGAVLLAACGGDGGSTNVQVGGFSVSLSSSSLQVNAGGNGSVTATITRTGSFSGTVELSTENVPTGITASFSPSSISSSTTSTTLNVAVAANVTPGSYTFTIRGKANGLADQTGTVNMTVAVAPSIALTLTPTTASVVQGGNTTFAATLTRTNFTGAVAVAVTGAPTGVTTNVTTNGDASSVAVTVGAGTAVGAYPLTVTASGTGVSNAVATFTLTVTAAPTGSYTMAATPATLSVQQGSNGQATIDLTRTNFTGTVNLAAEGLPNGVTPAFGQSALTTSQTTLTLSVGGAVAAGDYTVTVRGTSTGLADRTATFTLRVTAAPAGSIAVALTPTAATVNQGANTTFTVNITRTNFTGNVAVALTGLPGGVTPTITTTPTTTNSVQVQLAVGAGVLPGTYGVNVNATGSGVPDATAQFNLTVAQAPSIAITPTPASANVIQGSNTQFTVNIARTNFPGNVTLAVTGAPNGVTTSIATSPTAGNSAVVTVNVGGGTTPGNYPLTVTGSGAGIANATLQFALTVSAVQSNGNVQWAFGNCVNADRPIWFAAQDGAGAWTQVIGNGNTYSFTISTFGGVAYVTQNGANDYDVNFYYGGVQEMQVRGQDVCAQGTLKTVNGSVAGVGAGQQAGVSVGNAYASLTSPTTTFQLTNVVPGTIDAVAARSAINFQNPLAGYVTNKLIIRRGLNPADGSTLPVFDFNAGEAFDPDTKNVTVNGLAGGETAVSVANTYVTSNQGFALLGNSLLSGGTGTYVAVPGARQATGDLHAMNVSAITTSGLTNTSTRIVTTVFKDAADKTVTLPSALNTPTISSVATAPYLRSRFQLARQADFDKYWALGYGQTGRAVTVFMSAGYLGSSAYDFQFPDFTGVAGWQNGWAPVSGQSTIWNLSASGWTLGGNGFGNTYSEGTVVKTGARTGQFTP